MVTSEREMVKMPAEPVEKDRSTSLQPTYEDSVPASEDDWEFEDS
jgi:hypothetical protein